MAMPQHSAGKGRRIAANSRLTWNSKTLTQNTKKKKERNRQTDIQTDRGKE